MFIRYFADTTGSGLSIAALEYLRSFMRIAPVRLVSVTGCLAGRWQAYGALLATPMAGASFISAVCADPSKWTWIQKVPAGASAVDHTQIRDGAELDIPEATETITGRCELYTKGHHNVLFAVSPPRSAVELETAKKYEAIVLPDGQNASAWVKHGKTAHVIPTPVGDPHHSWLRSIFLPPSEVPCPS